MAFALTDEVNACGLLNLAAAHRIFRLPGLLV